MECHFQVGREKKLWLKITKKNEFEVRKCSSISIHRQLELAWTECDFGWRRLSPPTWIAWDRSNCNQIMISNTISSWRHVIKIWLEIASVLWKIIFWQRCGLKVVQHLTFTHAKITFKPHLDKKYILQLLSDLTALVWPSRACRSRRHLPLIFDENKPRARSVAIKTTQF